MSSKIHTGNNAAVYLLKDAQLYLNTVTRSPLNCNIMRFLQAATAVGMTSIDVSGAGVTESEKATSVVSKKTTATPVATAVPVILVPAATPVATAVPLVPVPAATPATTTPAVAVSGWLLAHLLSSETVATCSSFPQDDLS